MNVSVIAVTVSIGPFSHIAVSMQWASRSPVTPLPATLASSRHRPVAALRQIGGDRPVLKELGAVVKDSSEPSLVDQLLGERHGGDAAVIVPDHVRNFRRLDGGDHLHRFSGVAAERLLAHHHLAGRGGGDRDLGVGVVGAGDVDEVDVLARHQLAPVRFEGLIAPILGEGFNACRVARANRLQDRLIVERRRTG